MSRLTLGAARLNFTNELLARISESEDKDVIESIDDLLRIEEIREEIIDGLRRLHYDVKPIATSGD